MAVKSKAEAEKIAVDFVETWKNVKNPKIESSEKVFIEEPECARALPSTLQPRNSTLN